MHTGLILANTIVTNGQNNLFGKDFIKSGYLLAKIIFQVVRIQAEAYEISGI